MLIKLTDDLIVHHDAIIRAERHVKESIMVELRGRPGTLSVPDQYGTLWDLIRTAADKDKYR